jgi:hypothetical protein
MVEKNERRWVLYFALAVMIMTTLPYLVGFWVQGDQWRFTGFVFGADDGNSYIAKMLAGSTGDWLFKTPYTAYPQNGVVAFLPYILLGKLAAPPAQHDQLVFLFQLFRWIGGFMVVLATYDFAAIFIRKIQYRRLATALVTLGGGLGWLAVLGLSGLWQGRLPLEFYSPETFGFLSILGLPHLEVARACLLWGIRDYLTNAEGLSWKRAVRGGMWWLAMGLFQPLTVVIGWAVLGLHVVVVTIWKNFRGFHLTAILRQQPEGNWIISCVVMALISAPIVVYTFIAFSIDPFLRQWTEQNLILSPPVGDYLLAFVSVLPLALIGIVIVFRKRDWSTSILALWVIAIPILAYAPYNLQRRLPEGAWAALVILSLGVVENYLAKYRKAVATWTAVGCLSTIMFFAGAVFTVASPASPLFIPKAEADAFQFMNGITAKPDVVLATFRISNELPAWTQVRTIVGHGPESINAASLTPRIDSFFSQAGKDADRLALIAEFDVKYVIIGSDEQSLQSWDANSAAFASLIYQNSGYKIYQVKKP